MEIQNKCGAVTLATPFVIRENGIFFEQSSWGLKLVNALGSVDLHTMVAIKETLNQAYQRGYADGVQVGIKLQYEN
jgi:hypothetical protein